VTRLTCEAKPPATLATDLTRHGTYLAREEELPTTLESPLAPYAGTSSRYVISAGAATRIGGPQ
jgi:hypothetical protein